MEDQGTFPQAGAAVPEIPGFQASGPAEISGSVLVWDAVQLSLERPVRIMAPVPGDEESSAAFRRIAALARSVARIGSGDVVQVIDVAPPTSPLQYVVLEKLDGDSLSAWRTLFSEASGSPAPAPAAPAPACAPAPAAPAPSPAPAAPAYVPPAAPADVPRGPKPIVVRRSAVSEVAPRRRRGLPGFVKAAAFLVVAGAGVFAVLKRDELLARFSSGGAEEPAGEAPAEPAAEPEAPAPAPAQVPAYPPPPPRPASPAPTSYAPPRTSYTPPPAPRPAPVALRPSAANIPGGRISGPKPYEPSLYGSADYVVPAVVNHLVRWVREQPFAETKAHAGTFLRKAAERRNDLEGKFREIVRPFVAAVPFEDLVGNALTAAPAEREITVGGVAVRIRPTGYVRPTLLCDVVKAGQPTTRNSKLPLDKMTDAEKLSAIANLPVDADPPRLASRAFLLMRAGTPEQFFEFVKKYKLADFAPFVTAMGGDAGPAN